VYYVGIVLMGFHSLGEASSLKGISPKELDVMNLKLLS